MEKKKGEETKAGQELQKWRRCRRPRQSPAISALPVEESLVLNVRQPVGVECHHGPAEAERSKAQSLLSHEAANNQPPTSTKPCPRGCSARRRWPFCARSRISAPAAEYLRRMGGRARSHGEDADDKGEPEALVAEAEEPHNEGQGAQARHHHAGLWAQSSGWAAVR